MGVKGLKFYMSNVCKDVCHRVDIEDMAREHRRHRVGDDKPIAVIDGLGFMDVAYPGGYDWAYGGQWVELISALKNCVERFSKAGIELVFFFDGPITPEKRQPWIVRRMRSAENLDNQFRAMKETRQLPNRGSPPLTNTGSITRFALKLSCNVEVHTTIKEADIEIAEYAKNNDRVFAILTDDTDFMIFDTKPVLSLNDMRMEDLTSILYDRQKLVSQLGLDITQMPLFSCLLGNDFVSHEFLKPFHDRLRVKNEKRGFSRHIIPLVVKLIATRKWEGSSQNERELARISDEVFGENKIGLLKTGINFYSLRSANEIKSYTAQSTQDAVAYKRHVDCENVLTIYGILYYHEYYNCEVLEDYNNTSEPSVNLSFRPIRQRAYSILFQGDKSVRVKEWCVAPRHDLNEPDIVSQMPINIQGPLPTLAALWCNSSPEIQETKMKCFFACIGEKLSYSQMVKLQDKHKIFCCVLHYLMELKYQNKEVIRPWEVEAFIAQAICPGAGDVAWLESVKVPEIDTRAIYLASLFMRGVTTLEVVLGICGYPIALEDSMPWKFFNGKLFHSMYLRAKQGAQPSELCGQNANVIEQFRTLWEVINIGLS